MKELSTPATYGHAVIEMQKHVYERLNAVELQHVHELLNVSGETSEKNEQRMHISAKLEACRESKEQLLENKDVYTSAFVVFQDNLADTGVVRGGLMNTQVLCQKAFENAAIEAGSNVLKTVTKIREDRLVARYSA